MDKNNLNSGNANHLLTDMNALAASAAIEMLSCSTAYVATAAEYNVLRFDKQN
ncbi:unnamed protein product [Dovyalis caffra]|uniref:NADH dehydrogenase subunit 4L n=1 Tax=Dovyalis caffra TaxID=77055 RepID=A0AAV1R0Y7_9ROSI|nr:unnamed protein product [Dovyalis caffra]